MYIAYILTHNSNLLNGYPFSYKHGFDEESYDENEDFESSEDSYDEDERMNIMTVSRTHRDVCEGYYDTHFQGNSIFPLNPRNVSRNVWSEDSNSDSKERDENSDKKDIGVQGK